MNGFGLAREDALPFLEEYNQRAQPPWSEHRLKYKLAEADKIGPQPGKTRGYLLHEDNPEGSKNGKLFGEKLAQEFAQSNANAESSEDGEPIRLEKETEQRLKQYLTDQEPFPSSMRPEAFHGVFGEIVGIMAQHCESSPEVLLLHGLVIAGNIFGRSAYVYGGGPRLFPNEFAVFVGETARGRKGTAHAMWEELATLANPDWFKGCLTRQAQSGEGVVVSIRDPRHGRRPGKRNKDEPSEEVLLDEGVSDKRLLIFEEEFSHTLKMAQRTGNTLSEILRVAWDSPHTLRNANKNSPIVATDPHVSFIGHTTRDELLVTLKSVDLNNGFANRVLWCAARRTGDMPNAEFLNWRAHPEILKRLKGIFYQRFANTDEPVYFSRHQTARNYWDAIYCKLNAQKQGSTIDAVLARDTSHILKLALIFTICDQADQIERRHLEASLAVVDFCQASTRWIFGRATGNKLANNILVALRRSPAGLTRNEIKNDVCFRNTPKSQTDTALCELVRNDLASMILEEAEKGRRIERWFAKAKALFAIRSLSE